MTTSLRILRGISLTEGVSFLLLLFLAMPMKYMFDQPIYVRVIGLAHGILFVALCVSLLQVLLEEKWPIRRCAIMFIASLLPFGPFIIDWKFFPAWSSESETPKQPAQATDADSAIR